MCNLQGEEKENAQHHLHILKKAEKRTSDTVEEVQRRMNEHDARVTHLQQATSQAIHDTHEVVSALENKTSNTFAHVHNKLLQKEKDDEQKLEELTKKLKA